MQAQRNIIVCRSTLTCYQIFNVQIHDIRSQKCILTLSQACQVFLLKETANLANLYAYCIYVAKWNSLGRSQHYKQQLHIRSFIFFQIFKGITLESYKHLSNCLKVICRIKTYFWNSQLSFAFIQHLYFCQVDTQYIFYSGLCCLGEEIYGLGKKT